MPFVVGDCIVSGIYRLHSRFEQVVNYSCRDSLLSLTTISAGSGPINISGWTDWIPVYDFLRLENHHLTVNSRTYDLTASLTYHSIFIPPEFDRGLFLKNSALISSYLLRLASSRSLAFILRSQPHILTEVSVFERAFRKRIFDAVESWMSGNRIESIELLRGCGYGLTPSGDDFITGMLAGARLLEWLHRIDLTDIRSDVARTAQTSNLLSYTAIRFAAEGRFFEKLKNLLKALFEPESKNLEVMVNRVLSSGETSGADLMSGFLFSLFKGEKTWLSSAA